MKPITIALTILLLFMLVAVNLALGSVMLPLDQVLGALTGDASTPIVAQNIVLKSRLPQTFTAIFAGAGLAVSGLIMQTIFRNPLAGPTVLGISNGASLGVALIVLLNGAIGGQALATIGIRGEMATVVAGIMGALLIMFLIIQVSTKVKSSVTLLIFGVMVGYVANAFIGVLKFFSIEEDVRTFVVWGLGSFSRVSPDRLLPFSCLMTVTLLASIPMAKQLNIMLKGLTVPASSIVMNVGTAAVGYGYEYVSSTLDRVRLAALAQSDADLQMPIIAPVSTDTWGVKESVATIEDAPEWGNQEERAIAMEVATAAADLTGGSDAVIMRHPTAVATIKQFINELV